MHATIVQAIDQRVQTYAIQLIHARIIQIIPASDPKQPFLFQLRLEDHVCDRNEHYWSVCQRDNIFGSKPSCGSLHP